MSGGSFGYLCCAEVNDLFLPSRMEALEQMEKELLYLGYADIAKDVRRLIEYCLTAENRISVLFEQLEEVFHDVEWYCSADIGKETLLKRLEQYREGSGNG